MRCQQVLPDFSPASALSPFAVVVDLGKQNKQSTVLPWCPPAWLLCHNWLQSLFFGAVWNMVCAIVVQAHTCLHNACLLCQTWRYKVLPMV